METSNYIESFHEQLKKARKEVFERDQSRPRLGTISDRVNYWWEGLEASAKHLEYPISFISDRVGVAPPQLGPVLHSLGWCRRRRWQTNRPHSRVWFKPRAE